MQLQHLQLHLLDLLQNFHSAAIDEQLEQLGWKVVRVWDLDVRANPQQVAAAVLRVLCEQGCVEFPREA